MLEFIQKPPQGPEDVRLSENGKVLLECASGWDQVNALGRAACSELVDAFGEAGTPRDSDGNIVLKEVTGFLPQAAEILSGSDMHALANGLNGFRLELIGREVPA